MNRLRQNVRNFLCGASMSEVFTELRISDERKDGERAGYIREWIKESLGEHLECLAYICGNYRTAAHWADLWEGDGSGKIISLVGYGAYHEVAPEFVHESDPRFSGFIKACETGEDIDYIRENWRE